MKLHTWLAGLIALGWAGFSHAATVGFETVLVPVAGDKPLQVAIWYPSTTPEATERLALGEQTVAHGGAIAGGAHGHDRDQPRNRRVQHRPF